MNLYYVLTTSNGRVYSAFGQGDMSIKVTDYTTGEINNISLKDRCIPYLSKSEIYGKVIWDFIDVCLPISHASESEDLYIVLLEHRDEKYHVLTNPVHFTEFFIPHEYFNDEMLETIPEFAPEDKFTKELCEKLVTENACNIFNIPAQFATKELLNLEELDWLDLCGHYSRFQKGNMEKLFPTKKDWDLAMKYDSDAWIFMDELFKSSPPSSHTSPPLLTPGGEGVGGRN